MKGVIIKSVAPFTGKIAKNQKSAFSLN